MIRNDLRAPGVHAEFIERIEQLRPDTPARWGKMNVAQMLAHCAEVQEVLNGKQLNGTPFLLKLFRSYIRKMVVNDVPYRRNVATHPQYRQSGEKDFLKEKERLLVAVRELQETGGVDDQTVTHGLFGKLTHEERCRAGYKHLDHHLQQFGM